MEDKERRKLERGERQVAYMTANAGDYAANSPGAKVAALMTADVALVKEFAAGKAGGASESSQHISSKQDDLDELKDLMKLLDRAGDALADEFPGIENLFGLPRNRNQQSILAAAQAQYEASAKYETSLLEYDLPKNFRAGMLDLISGINAGGQAAEMSGNAGVGSTSGLKAALARLVLNSKKIDGINRNKLRSDPAKLGAWLTANHLERDPQKSVANLKTPPKV